MPTFENADLFAWDLTGDPSLFSWWTIVVDYAS